MSVVEVANNPPESRYEVRVNGELAGFAQYRTQDGRIVFFHTEIDPEYEGEGLGSRLAQVALDDVRGQEKEVLPLCPFIAQYIRRHAEYADLLPASLRKRFGATA
jgi:predicted GNAT family acetyltransferase